MPLNRTQEGPQLGRGASPAASHPRPGFGRQAELTVGDGTPIPNPACGPGAGPAAAVWGGGVFLCSTNSRLWPL